MLTKFMTTTSSTIHITVSGIIVRDTSAFRSTRRVGSQGRATPTAARWGKAGMRLHAIGETMLLEHKVPTYHTIDLFCTACGKQIGNCVVVSIMRQTYMARRGRRAWSRSQNKEAGSRGGTSATNTSRREEAGIDVGLCSCQW